MISLVSPLESEDRFFIWNNIAIGPCDLDGLFQGEETQFRSSLSAIDQSKGIYGDNNVTHDKISGDVYYVPGFAASLAAPTMQYPYYLKIPAYDLSTYDPYWKKVIDAYFGFARSKQTARGYSGTSLSQIINWAFYRNPDTGLWTMTRILAFATSPTLITNCDQYEILSIRPNSTSKKSIIVSYRVKTYSSANGWPTGLDWTQERSYDDFESVIQGRPISKETTTTSLGSIYKFRYDAIFNPRDSRRKIDSLVASLFPEEFPIKDKHYGDLASEASQQVNANSVNMIAFLRDLRKPQELIPKLRKLRNLKGLSDNYLTVEYGILPTISDIEEIIRAVKRIGPYLDKNGFETYTAGYHEVLTDKSMTYELTQRVKLAIDDEDDEFQALVQRLDSMGTLPTFENVWDLVPYSFVIDWFVDVGGFLERVDSSLRLSRLNIRYVTMSRKTNIRGSITTPKPETPFVGTIDWVHYHRWVSDQCPVPPLSLQTTFELPRHWLEAGALLAQRSKR